MLFRFLTVSQIKKQQQNHEIRGANLLLFYQRKKRKCCGLSLGSLGRRYSGIDSKNSFTCGKSDIGGGGSAAHKYTNRI